MAGDVLAARFRQAADDLDHRRWKRRGLARVDARQTLPLVLGGSAMQGLSKLGGRPCSTPGRSLPGRNPRLPPTGRPGVQEAVEANQRLGREQAGGGGFWVLRPAVIGDSRARGRRRHRPAAQPAPGRASCPATPARPAPARSVQRVGRHVFWCSCRCVSKAAVTSEHALHRLGRLGGVAVGADAVGELLRQRGAADDHLEAVADRRFQQARPPWPSAPWWWSSAWTAQ